ncbi:uncharacterized protein METZ01_LOCUS240257 [marine metagenome]|uniref:Uncharacterized protein n=1 Tax=marine metagenome TaxID=408172 RepID=A0A382HL72_9ZZZZ
MFDSFSISKVLEWINKVNDLITEM